jgi:nitrite reductase/ring-hydroxylating ferredoxin subunit
MKKKWFYKAILVGVLASLLILGLASCSAISAGNPTTSALSNTPPATTTPSATPLVQSGNPSNQVKQLTIDVQVNNDTVIIPLDKVTTNLNTRFKLATKEGEMTFMAYIWDGKLNVRADICPPCRSKSFTLTKGTLVCDACGTVFDAVNGKGIRGACVAYPKEAVSYQLSGESVVVSQASLITAYKDTLQPN